MSGISRQEFEGSELTIPSVGGQPNFSADQRFIVETTSRGLLIRDAGTGEEQMTLEDKDDTQWVAGAFDVSPVGPLVAQVGSRKMEDDNIQQSLKIWDISTGQVDQECKLAASNLLINDVCFSNDGEKVAIGCGFSGTVNGKSFPPCILVCDLQQQMSLRKFDELKVHPENVSFSPNGATILSSSYSGSYSESYLLDADTGGLLLTIPGGNAVFIPDGKKVLTCDSNVVRILDAATGEGSQTIRMPTASVQRVAISSDGTRIAAAAADNTIKLWDISTGEQILLREGHTDTITEMQFSPDCARLLTASFDHSIRCWDLQSTDGARRLSRTSKSPHAISPDSTQVVARRTDGISIWDVKTGAESCRLEAFYVRGGDATPTALSYSEDGRYSDGKTLAGQREVCCRRQILPGRP